jgi:hypothetical protein
MIVGGSGSLTTGADPSGIAARADLDFDGIGLCAQACLLVDEAREALTVIQEGDELHGKKAVNKADAIVVDDDLAVYCQSFPTWYESEGRVVFPTRYESERG